MNKQLLIKVVFVLTAAVSGFAFAACGGSSSSSAPSKPAEMTEEQKKAKEGSEALAAKKAEYTIIPTKVQLAKDPYRNKSLIFYRFDKDRKDEKDKWVMNDFGFGSDSAGTASTNEAATKLRFKLAENPDEVGTIALLPECRNVEAGQYGSAALAYKERCEVILIDKEMSAVVYRKIFEGELESTKTISNGETSVVAKVDRMKIVDFLSYLDKKGAASPANTDKK